VHEEPLDDVTQRGDLAREAVEQTSMLLRVGYDPMGGKKLSVDGSGFGSAMAGPLAG